MNTLYLLHYNNYYNRIIKQEDNLTAYLEYAVGEPLQNINFVPNDGINTEQVINITDMDNVDLLPADYLLVVQDSSTILSRWFILRQQRTLRGQVILTLRRDIVTDHLDKVLNAEYFIEKGIISSDDDAIFNSENMTYSQIKRQEYLIKDSSACPWIVGYYARKTGENITTLSGSFDPQQAATINLSTPITEWEEFQYTQTWLNGAPDPIGYGIGIAIGKSVYVYKKYALVMKDYASDLHFVVSRRAANMNYSFTRLTVDDEALKGAFDAVRSTLRAQAGTIIPFVDNAREQEFKNYQGQVIKDSTGAYYSIDVDSRVITLTQEVKAGSLFETLKNAMLSAGFQSNLGSGSSWTLTYLVNQYMLKLTRLTGIIETSYNITANRRFTQDAPYDIFAIPYSDTFQFKGSAASLTTKADISLKTAMDIASKYSGGGVLYDIQLLPFCPFAELVTDGYYETTDSLEYSYIKQGSVNVGVIFNIAVSKFQNSISQPHIVIGNYKVDSETKFIRICSPNYNGVFEMTPAKNGGVNSLNIWCTYKPYNPYIQIAPQFGRLYGQNFNDARGLICGGDFSLPVVTDQWQTYEITHKNYAAIFDRQIENLELNNNVSRERERWQVAAGMFNGGVSGLMAGAQTGNAYAAVGGATIGSVMSLAGGLKDIELNELLRNEAIDYARDSFGYTLGNIRALPNTLNKVSAFNVNNKIFPFIEYYDCPDVERDALIRKIEFNGMTVGRIGRLNEYIRTWTATLSNGQTIQINYPYIKGQLIRLDDIEVDANILKAISHEIYLGVFIDANSGSN